MRWRNQEAGDIPRPTSFLPAPAADRSLPARREGRGHLPATCVLHDSPPSARTASNSRITLHRCLCPGGSDVSSWPITPFAAVRQHTAFASAIGADADGLGSPSKVRQHRPQHGPPAVGQGDARGIAIDQALEFACLSSSCARGGLNKPTLPALWETVLAASGNSSCDRREPQYAVPATKLLAASFHRAPISTRSRTGGHFPLFSQCSALEHRDC